MKSEKMTLHLSTSCDERVSSFKSNAENMLIVQEFVDELIASAKTKAEESAKQKNAAQIQITPAPELEGDLKRRFGTRARGFMTRLVEAICHCANTARAAATNAANR